MLVFYIFIFFRFTEPISNKLRTNHPNVKKTLNLFNMFKASSKRKSVGNYIKKFVGFKRFFFSRWKISWIINKIQFCSNVELPRVSKEVVKIGVQSLNYKRDGEKTNVLLNSKIVDKFLTFLFQTFTCERKWTVRVHV